MEFVREIIDSDRLISIITLPESFSNKKVEIIVLPLNEEYKEEKTIDKDISVKDSSITKSLIGALATADISLEQIREGRLSKYESIN